MKLQLLDIRLVWDGVLPRCVRVWGRSETGEAASLDFPYKQHFWVSGEWPGEWRANQLAGQQKVKCFCQARCGKESPYSKPWPCLERNKSYDARGYREENEHGTYKAREYLPACVIGEKEERKTPFVGYHPGPIKMTKVSVCAPWAVRLVERALRRSDPELVFYEAHIGAEQRFMVDNGMSGCCWIDENGVCEPPAAAIAPLVTLSLDIECCSLSGGFPMARSGDPVITVAFVVSVYGRAEREYATFQLGGATDWEGAQGELHTFTDEANMLEAAYGYMRSTNADLIAGYNSDHFDLPYLIERAAILKCPKAFKYNLKNTFGTHAWHSATVKRQSAQMGEREVSMHSLVGTVTFDVMDIVRDSHKLRSYALDAVATHFLGDQKDDVKYSEIPQLMKSSAGRGKLARYCQQDTVLVANLIEQLHLVTNAVEFAKVTGATLDGCLHRGQSVKVEANILMTTAPRGVVLQTFDRPWDKDEVVVPLYLKFKSAVSGGKGKTGFKGATVLEPIKGFYKDPVAVLDFASLYPNIIIAYNLSHDTILSSIAEAKRLGVAYNLTPEGTVFVKPEVKQGILPLVLRTLLDARKQAKEQMKNADTAFEKAVFNGKQLALKISANSVYGFCGATTGRTPCVYVSSATTSYGRRMIDTTADFARQNYGAEVVYGDTDSVFVKFPAADLARTWELAADMEKKINHEEGPFEEPNYLELEKTYENLFVIAKKRYAGLLYDSPGAVGYLSVAGLELVRRDNSPCVPMIQKGFLNALIVDADPDRAIRDYHAAIRGLGSLSIDQFIMTRKLAKAQYVNPQIHAELNAKLKARPGCKPHLVGDRVDYVVTTGKGKLYTRGECPKYIEMQAARLECTARIDVDWYRSRIMDAMDRLLRPLWGYKNLSMFNERMRQTNLNYLTPDGMSNAPWFPRVLAAGAATEAPKIGKKRKRKNEPDDKQPNITSFFKMQ